MIKVTNKNAFEFTDRYNGQDFKIPAGKTVALAEDAAAHFFGLGQSDKIPYLSRQGWMNNSGQLSEAMQKLNNFTFDFADDLVPGEIVEAEQGSAPLHPESVREPNPDGAADITDSTLLDEGGLPSVPVLGRPSILDKLGGAA